MVEAENFEKLLDIDQDDKKILELLQNNCDLTHKEISEKINKSQPAVGARILKLERKGLLVRSMGINYKVAKIPVAYVRIKTSNASKFWEKYSNCPYIMNLFRITGEYNVHLDVAGPNVKTIEYFIDNCIRQDENVINIETTYILDSAFDYLLKVNFNFQDYIKRGCNFECRQGISREELDKLMNEEN